MGKLSRELAEDLARQLQQAGWMVWVNMPMGSVLWSNPGIADVIAISKSYKPTVRVFEVKASRDDFWGDVNRGKYLKYLENCNQFFFAAEAGVLKKEDIPQGCGLITRGSHGWHVQMAARRTDCQLSTEFLLALLMKGYQDHQQKVRTLQEKGWYEYKGLADAASKFGKKFAQDLARGPEYLREAQELQKKVDEALGVNHDDLAGSLWFLRGKTDQLLIKYKYAEEVVKLTDILMRIFQGHTYQVIEELRGIAGSLEAKKQ